MKLIVAIVDGQDADDLMSELAGQSIRFTHISSSGGLFSPTRATLLIGLDDKLVPLAMSVITNVAATRKSMIAFDHELSLSGPSVIETEVGGFVAYVLDVDDFEQV